MDQNNLLNDEIEESLRICEELLNNKMDFLPEKPELDLDNLLGNDKTEPETRPEAQMEADPQRELEPEPDEKSEPESEPDEKNEPELEQKTQIEIMPTKKISSPKKIEEKKTEEKRGGIRPLINVLICVGIALAAALFITNFVANHTTVDGCSMEPALYDGDNLVVEKLSYLFGEPERFDVVVFKHSEETKYIKRIIGLPGERVRIEEGKIYINDKPIYDAFGNGKMDDAGIAEEDVLLGSDEYFVLGDNRDESEDSRDKNVGAVKGDTIIGRAWFRVTPFERLGTIER